IIGTLSKQANSENFQTIIITGDRDLTQLATDDVTIYYTKKGVTDVDHYTPEFIAEKYDGLTPTQIIDMKGLMGDTSDNIPGVAGVGEKTAIKLLKQFSSVENVYNHIDQVSGKKLKEKLENSKDDALMSKTLATINCESPIEVALEDTKLPDHPHTEDKVELFKKLEFNQLLNQMDVSNDTSSAEEMDIEIEQDFSNVDFQTLSSATIHFELDGVNYLKDNILKFGLYDGEHHVVINADQIKTYPALVAWLEDDTTEKIVYDAKKSYIVAHRLDINIKHIVFDVMLASYIIDPSRTIDDVNSVVANYGQHYVQSSVAIYGKGKKKHIAEDEVLNPYVATSIEAIDQVKSKIQKQLDEYNQSDLLYDLELPLARILSEMEETGIYTEISELQKM